MPLLNVRLLESWNGYKAGSVLQVTERAYYLTRTQGVKMNLISDSSEHRPTAKPLTKKELKMMHDHPFSSEEE
jgi:hypothetical protein